MGQFDSGKAGATNKRAGNRGLSTAVCTFLARTAALALPANWREADALSVIAAGPDGATLWSWTWPTPALDQRVARFGWGRGAPAASAAKEKRGEGAASPTVDPAAGAITLRGGEVTAAFDAATGLLREIRRGGKAFALAHGPRLAFARPPSGGAPEWLAFADTTGDTRRLAQPGRASVVEVEFENLRGGAAFGGLKLELSADGSVWKTVFDATRRPGDGTRYEFPPQLVAAVRLTSLRRHDGLPPVLRVFRVGHAAGRFPGDSGGAAAVTSGTERDAATGETVAWLEARGGAGGLERVRWTLRGDGALRLDYRYALADEFAFHGITFDHAVERIASHRWLGEGPHRVWQNRRGGTTLGVHATPRREQQPGEAFVYPEFEGYFAGVRWTRLATSAGALTIGGMKPETYLRIGTPRISHPNTMPDFPGGELSFLHAIPAIGSKFKTPAESGPSGQFDRAGGGYAGTLVFRFGE